MEIYSFHGSLGKLYSDNDNDILSLYGYLQHNLICPDRFGFLNQYSPWMVGQSDNYSDIISDYNNTYKKFKSIFYNRIKELAKLNEKLYVSWSGGVDSSAIVCGLLSYDKFDKNNLKILHTKESIEEYPLLYDILVKNDIEMIDLSNDLHGELYKSSINDGIIIMGWCADQLFGSIVNQYYPEYFNKSYKDWMNLYFNNIIGFPIDNAVGQCEEAFNHYNLPVKTFPEWTWFFNFFVKWNVVKIDPFATVEFMTDRIINFFDTLDFQKWALNNFDTLSKKPQFEPSSYKLELKRIIEEYTKDSEYTRTKGKNGSWVNMTMAQKKLYVALIDNEGFKCYNPKYSVHPNRMSNVEHRIVSQIVTNYRK